MTAVKYSIGFTPSDSNHYFLINQVSLLETLLLKCADINLNDLLIYTASGDSLLCSAASDRIKLYLQKFLSCFVSSETSLSSNQIFIDSSTINVSILYIL